ncbi:Major facilitator superfamily protein [Trifolium repens]|nr:Major facilitator superfamily protein [Trifolium repens]
MSFIIGTVLSWRALSIIGLIPTAVLLFGLFFIPESPRWLAKRGRAEDFMAALQILRGKDADISQEADEIQDYITSLERLAKPKMLDLFQRRYLRSLTIGVGLMVCQQLGGINGVCFYTSSIFDLAGFPSTTGSIIYAIIQIMITGVGAALIDKVGRKPLLLASGSGLVAGCIFTAVAFYLKVHNVGVGAVPALALTGILVRLLFLLYRCCFICIANYELILHATFTSSTILGLIPTAVLLLGLFFIPESPRWLAKRGRAKDFVAALQILRGKDTDISQEAEEIQDYITSLEQLAKPKMLDLFQRRYMRSLTCSLVAFEYLGYLLYRHSHYHSHHYHQGTKKVRMKMEIKEDDVEDGKQIKGGIREPFIVHANKEHHHHHPWMVYFTTFIAVCGSYEFGACAGYSSPTQEAIRKDLNLTLAEYSLFGSILTFGAMIGAITSGPIADFVGRKGAMRVSSAFCIAGWLVIYFSQGPVPLDIGRLATGYGMGVFSFVVPVFVAEIAPKELRGALTTLNQFMIVTAVSVSFIIGTVLSWRALAIIGLIPTAVLLLGLFFIPESPRWLAKRGRAKDFVAALQILRGKDTDISQEAEEIQDYITSLEQLAKPKMLDLFQRRYTRSLTIGVGLMFCQQLGGINGVCFYTSSIFDLAGFPSTTGTIIYAILQIVITGVGAALIDKAGRKPLLLVSGSGLVAGCIFTAVAFYLKVHDVAVGAVPALALTGILIYIGSFSIGMGAIPWVVMSEIFPVNIKGQAGSIATLVNWFGAWLCSYTFNFLMAWSSYGTFVLYATINALAILFIVSVVPETKGKSLEQLQAAINA